MVDYIYKYNRYSIRLTGYDYSQPGYYFITLCTQDRDKRFGVIRDKKIQLNDVGKMVDLEWNQIPKRYKHVIMDKYIIMPDHFHGIIHIIHNKTIPVNDENPPVCNENTVGTSLVGVHPEKLSVHPESHGIHVGSHDIFNAPDNVHNEMRDVCVGSQWTGTSPVPTGKTLFEIIGAFKSITTYKYIDGVKMKNWPRFNKRLWQLRYHDHIIRNENELNRIREYIITNPLNYHTP